MRQLIFPVIALAGALVAVVPAIDLAAAPKPRNPPVRVTFADDPADNIKSDQRGSYVNGQSGVVAHINLSDNGHLVVYNNPTPGVSPRLLELSFTQCLESCTGAPFESGFTAVNFIAGVREASTLSPVPGGLLGMALAPLGDYRSGRTIQIAGSPWWTLCMTPNNVDGVCGISDHSTPGRIVRNAPDRWTVTASPADGSDVGELVKQSGTAKNKTFSIEGKYSMPVSFTVQCLTANCS